jgi:phosphate uptake regulator
MITLPKKWAKEVDLQAGSSLVLIPQEKSLILKPLLKERPSRGMISIDKNKVGDILIREIISFYISGFDIVEVCGERITSEQRKTTRKITQALIGPEIMEESSNTIVIHNLLNLSELSEKKSLERIYRISRSMFLDAISAFSTADSELAQDVVDRDDDVDRLFLVMARQFRLALRDVSAGINRVEFLDYYSAATQLERIADHAVKIAEAAQALKTTPPHIDAIVKGGELALEVVDDAVRALKKLDFGLANSSIQKSSKVDKLLSSAARLDPQAHLIGMVTESIRRVKDYGANIAEVALNAAAPVPE